MVQAIVAKPSLTGRGHSGVGTPCESIPPLEKGDRLTRCEFEQRYAAMPHIKKIELIEGVVYAEFVQQLAERL